MSVNLAKAIYGNAREEDAGYGVTRVLIQKGGVEVVFQPKGEHVMDVLAWLTTKVGDTALEVYSDSLMFWPKPSDEYDVTDWHAVKHNGTPEGIAEAVYQAAIQIVSSSSN